MMNSSADNSTNVDTVPRSAVGAHFRIRDYVTSLPGIIRVSLVVRIRKYHLKTYSPSLKNGFFVSWSTFLPGYASSPSSTSLRVHCKFVKVTVYLSKNCHYNRLSLIGGLSNQVLYHNENSIMGIVPRLNPMLSDDQICSLTLFWRLNQVIFIII